VSSKSQATGIRYRQPVENFIRSLGHRADKNLETLRTADIASFWKSERATAKSAHTCAFAVKVVKSALRSATKLTGLKQNPADGFEIPAETDCVEREVFTPQEIRRLIGGCEGDWPSVIRLAAFTGMRLECVQSPMEGDRPCRARDQIHSTQDCPSTEGGREAEKLTALLHPELEKALSALPGARPQPGFLCFSIASRQNKRRAVGLEHGVFPDHGARRGGFLS
jgi:hypothetical protein